MSNGRPQRKTYGPSIADRLRKVEDPALRMDLYLKAVQLYHFASPATVRKWRKIAQSHVSTALAIVHGCAVVNNKAVKVDGL
jgi:hypothetical protein